MKLNDAFQFYARISRSYFKETCINKNTKVFINTFLVFLIVWRRQMSNYNILYHKFGKYIFKSLTTYVVADDNDMPALQNS